MQNSWVAWLFNSLFNRQPVNERSTVAPVLSSQPAVQSVPPLLHQPLLMAMQAFDVKILPAGTVLYHGSREFSRYTDYAQRKLLGTRKWLSQNAPYAAQYAFNDPDPNGVLGKRLFWICELTCDLQCLEGRQMSLSTVAPIHWNFPGDFPSNYATYATQILKLQPTSPVALLDHFSDSLYKEVLLAQHVAAISVRNVIELPVDKPAAEMLVRTHTGQMVSA